MESFALKHKSTLNSASVILFIFGYLACGVSGWFNIQKLFRVNNNAGELLKMPITYSIICFLFLTLLIALAVFGYILKNKIMIFLALGYEFFFLVAFALLGIFASGNIVNKTVYDILLWTLSFVLIPVYGTIWHLNAFFFLIYIPLLIFGIVSVFKVYKKKK